MFSERSILCLARENCGWIYGFWPKIGTGSFGPQTADGRGTACEKSKNTRFDDRRTWTHWFLIRTKPRRMGADGTVQSTVAGDGARTDKLRAAWLRVIIVYTQLSPEIKKKKKHVMCWMGSWRSVEKLCLARREKKKINLITRRGRRREQRDIFEKADRPTPCTQKLHGYANTTCNRSRIKISCVCGVRSSRI